eukprot:TRINITY_DN776_c1_g1_i1.p1 TRINITY_DN776_c1_g1~~TRINITY_DN776_c1_g1_i1.p1  ORF type:complete len:275 (+),score=55.14 TRINITY_DN776_c1_g1_i1:180-1004(+)
MGCGASKTTAAPREQRDQTPDQKSQRSPQQQHSSAPTNSESTREQEAGHSTSGAGGPSAPAPDVSDASGQKQGSSELPASRRQRDQRPADGSPAAADSDLLQQSDSRAMTSGVPESPANLDSPGRIPTGTDASPKVSPHPNRHGQQQNMTQSVESPEQDLQYVPLTHAEIQKMCRWVDDVQAATPHQLPLPDVWGEVNESAVKLLEEVERERRARAQQREQYRRLREQSMRESVAGTDPGSSVAGDPSPNVSRVGSRIEGNSGSMHVSQQVLEN